MNMLLRIGDKLVNRQKIYRTIERILSLRCQGLSQQETAKQVGVDRTVISRLENMGEVRKGKSLALLGFPICNCEELEQLARQEGIDYCLLLTERQRWQFLQDNSGVELFNSLMRIIAEVRSNDTVIILASNTRITLIEAMLDKEVIGIQIGESPIAEDKYVDPALVREIIRAIR
ncbi:MAG: helix-turn-helix transcriptional regulator [Sporomusaceae bacterium]|nr:helix-turn-helix transcriptional regulator [Sporomusaceae bacterium]